MHGMGLSYQYLRTFGFVIRRASTSTIRKSFLTIRLFFGGTGVDRVEQREVVSLSR